MNLYLIKNHAKTLIYVVATSLNNAIKIYNELDIYKSEIDKIELIQSNIIIGE